MNSTFVKELYVDENVHPLEFDLKEFVESASKWIVPLGPLENFAARHPWANIEDRPFDQIARQFKETCNVDLYPNDSIIRSAWNHGEISQELLDRGLQEWLHLQQLELPRVIAFQYCRASLLQNKDFSHHPEKKELEDIAEHLLLNYKIPRKYSVNTYSQRLEQRTGERITEVLNGQMIKWCKLFLNDDYATWMMPYREKGFYLAWKSLIQYDPTVSKSIRKKLNNLPNEATQALMDALFELEISYSEIQDYLVAHLLALPGWAGMMLWRSKQSVKDEYLLIEYLAVRVLMELAFIKPYLPLSQQTKEDDKEHLQSLLISWAKWGKMPISDWLQLSLDEANARLELAERFDGIVRNRLWLEAWEQTYEDQLKNKLIHKLDSTANKRSTTIAQFAFCIDVRSEPFRRQLENAGPFETFGTAGFFGLPIETCELGSQHRHPSLPILFKPQFQVNECLSEMESKPFYQRQQTIQSLNQTFKKMKFNLPTSLLLPEISGPWLSLQTIARSILPRGAGSMLRSIRKAWLRKPKTNLTLDYVQTTEAELPIGFTEEEKVYYVRQALKMMGLTEDFAPLVIICGHGSHSTNNLYASAYDCGACGGASSGFNARVLATLCNLPEVRDALDHEGIRIPKETTFVAAEHMTTSDKLQFLYVPELSTIAKEAFNRIQEILPEVSNRVSAERMRTLPSVKIGCKNPEKEAQRLEEDWSETRPEWGLARNATMIIGRRELTRDSNLEGRAFLHNYKWEKDPSGEILSNIITGPTTVAQWINLQYYASTVAPHFYGSGNKTTQTVTAGIGVMQGNASDLLSGLPWQSVMKSDQEAFHAPIRLLVLVEAPTEYVRRILNENLAFHQKVQNGWIRLASIDSEGNWKSWS
nr:putative inorganic carbon transporter subunit DabA [Lysinibacillus timonensis]